MSVSGPFSSCVETALPAGISLGWGWGDPSYSRHNTVQGCNIHHTLCGELYDGGSIYTLGNQPDSSLQYNYLHDQCQPYGMLYHDSGSEGFNDHHNVCADSPEAWWLLINGDGAKCDIHDNWIDSSSATGRAACNATSPPTCAISATSNIFVANNLFPAEAHAVMAAAGPRTEPVVPPAPPAGSVSISWSEPVIIHGAWNSTWHGKPLRLDGNESMGLDSFYALTDNVLFGAQNPPFPSAKPA